MGLESLVHMEWKSSVWNTKRIPCSSKNSLELQVPLCWGTRQVVNEDTIFLIGVTKPAHWEKVGFLEKQEAHT